MINGKLAFGAINLAMALANLLATRFVERAPRSTNGILLFCNALVAWVVGYDYLLQGKKGLPYAWLVVGILYLIGSVVFWRKANLENETTEPGHDEE